SAGVRQSRHPLGASRRDGVEEPHPPRPPRGRRGANPARALRPHRRKVCVSTGALRRYWYQRSSSSGGSGSKNSGPIAIFPRSASNSRFGCGAEGDVSAGGRFLPPPPFVSVFAIDFLVNGPVGPLRSCEVCLEAFIYTPWPSLSRPLTSFPAPERPVLRRGGPRQARPRRVR